MKAIGIILAGGNNDGRLGVLTDHRAAAALPIGSCYRAIDFTLSNMSNSGIGKVAVLTQYNSRSLRDHLMSSNGGTSAESRAACSYSRRIPAMQALHGSAARRIPFIRI